MNKITRNALTLMIITIVSKILGFGRELILASSYGTSMYSDAYLIALNIPTIIFSVMGGALISTYIPLYCEINNNLGEREAIKFSNNIFNIITLISIVLSIMGILFAKPLVKLFAIGFDGRILDVTVEFVRILIIGIIFISMSNLFTPYLQIKENFTIPGIMSIPKNIIIIISIIFSLTYGVDIMIWGTLIGMLSEVIIQLPFIYKKGYRYKLIINLKDKYVKKMMILLGPVIIGVAVNQINIIVDRTIASTLVEGSISALNYANKLNAFIMSIIITSISAVIYPKLSNLSFGKNKEEYNSIIIRSINIIILLIIPISVGAIVLSSPIVKVLFQRGAFDITSVNMTSSALIFYSIGLIGFGLTDILGKVFYSLHDTKTPMITGVISMIFNVVLNILIVKFMAHTGLAFATSISSILGTLILFKSLGKKLGDFGQKNIISTLIKSLTASIIMGIIVSIGFKSIVNLLGNTIIDTIISLILSVAIGLIIYISVLLILKIDEFEVIKNKMKNT